MKRIWIDLSEDEYKFLIKYKGKKSWKEYLVELVAMYDKQNYEEFLRKLKLVQIQNSLFNIFSKIKEIYPDTEVLELIQALILSLLQDDIIKSKNLVDEVWSKINKKYSSLIHSKTAQQRTEAAASKKVNEEEIESKIEATLNATPIVTNNNQNEGEKK